MSHLIVTNDVWNKVNYTQKPLSSASKLVICPDTKSKFQITEHNPDTYKVDRKLWWPVAIILLIWGKKLNINP